MIETGKATVQGVELTALVTLVSPALDAAAKLEVQGHTVTGGADISRRTDGNGEVQGYALRNKHKAITIDCYMVSAATPGAGDDALKALQLPNECTKVTLANFDETDLNGDWVYEQGGQILRSPTGEAKITLPLVKFSHQTAANLTAAVT